MNFIYLINENFNKLFYLDFKTDKIKNLETDSCHPFEIISPTKLLVKWVKVNENINENVNEIVNEFLEYFNTDDSYLYFSESVSYKNFKKIFLLHNEWKDQAIINISEKKINRIKDKDQYGYI